MVASRFLRLSIAAGLLFAMASCATYRDDLDRAIAHYNAREYDAAVVLFDVLEPDLDSLSEAERARYSYFRGMSHFLLEQRRDARHWLGNAAARELAAKGALHPDEQSKMTETLDNLNQDRWGGAKTPTPTTTCKVDGDCGDGQFCDAGTCKDAPGSTKDAGSATKDEPDAGADAGCRSDADCSGTDLCKGGRCQKP
ncbi:MAG: hypothetical protein R3B72_33695 [Polyangiaceae bacterium]